MASVMYSSAALKQASGLAGSFLDSLSTCNIAAYCPYRADSQSGVVFADHRPCVAPPIQAHGGRSKAI
jgi:hypothetical protein